MLQTSYQKVTFASAEKHFFSGKPVIIDGYLLKAHTPGKAPAAVLSAACDGALLLNSGAIRWLYRDMASVLHRAGVTVLIVDGFTPRGFGQTCGVGPKSGKISHSERGKDSLGALRYLHSRPDVDAGRIVLVAYGATGGLRLMGETPEPAHGRFAAAVLFYPKCDDIGFGYRPYAPVQIFVGEKDEWNPPAACRRLVERFGASGAGVRLKVYPNTYHGFMKRMPPHTFTANRKLGDVTVGGNPVSAADAYRRTVQLIDATRH